MPSPSRLGISVLVGLSWLCTSTLSVFTTRPFPGNTALSAKEPLNGVSPVIPVVLRTFDLTDWACVLSKSHPTPLILLPGLLSPKSLAMLYMARRFKEAGYCIYQLEYGLGVSDTLVGMGDIRESAQELSEFVDKVLNSTKTTSVDIVTHGSGSLVAMWYLKFLGGNQSCRSFAGVAPMFRGTNFSGLTTVLKGLSFFDTLAALVNEFCLACTQVVEGSDLLLELHKSGEVAVKGVRYLMLMTAQDPIVTPFTSGFLSENTTHVVVEDLCGEPMWFPSHVSILLSPVAFGVLDSYLTPADARAYFDCQSS